MFCIIKIEEFFPLANFFQIDSRNCFQLCLLLSTRSCTSLNKPAGDGLELRFFKRREAKRHAAVGMFLQISSKFFAGLSTGKIKRFRTIGPFALGILHLMIQKLNHE